MRRQKGLSKLKGTILPHLSDEISIFQLNLTLYDGDISQDTFSSKLTILGSLLYYIINYKIVTKNSSYFVHITLEKKTNR